jgi:hypothetical protein
MTGIIAPIILSSPRAEPQQRPLARPPLPLASLPKERARPWQYAVSTIDNRGRVAETSVVRALGWAAAARLDIREQGA